MTILNKPITNSNLNLLSRKSHKLHLLDSNTYNTNATVELTSSINFQTLDYCSKKDTLEGTDENCKKATEQRKRSHNLQITELLTFFKY